MKILNKNWKKKLGGKVAKVTPCIYPCQWVGGSVRDSFRIRSLLSHPKSLQAYFVAFGEISLCRDLKIIFTNINWSQLESFAKTSQTWCNEWENQINWKRDGFPKENFSPLSQSEVKHRTLLYGENLKAIWKTLLCFYLTYFTITQRYLTYR